MSQLVVNGAKLKCSEGTAPSSLTVTTNSSSSDELLNATVMDHVPMMNIAPFGMCTTLANPKVSAATSAANGVLTPVPCEPVVPAPWTPGSENVVIDDKVALTDSSTCSCAWTGTIEIIDPGSGVVSD